jgi:hypothetical protein
MCRYLSESGPDVISRVAFIGDCLVSGAFGDGLAELPGLLSDCECFVINLECAITDDPAMLAVKSHPLWASYGEFRRVLAAFRGKQLIINYANNHADDAGDAALEAFTKWCGDQGVVVVGGDDACVVRLATGFRLGIFGGMRYPTSPRIGSLGNWDPQRIAALRAEVDQVICLAHWGEEYVFFPEPGQVRVAGELCAAGVGLVVGCHPHVIQGCGCFFGSKVYYSLGNGTMYLDSMLKGSRVGAAVIASYPRDGEPETGWWPFTVGKEGRLQPLTDQRSDRFNEILEGLSRFPESRLWWWRQAAGVFFSNHLASWAKRIRDHGWKEAGKMMRAFGTKTYLAMGLGLLSGLGRRTRNDDAAESVAALAERTN